jgi:TolB protein
MKNMKYFILTLILFFNLSFTKEYNVSLKTKALTYPILIETTFKEAGDDYMHKINQAIQFDFMVNAITFVLDPKTKKRIFLNESGVPYINFNSNSITPYLTIHYKVQEKMLDVYLTDQKKQTKHIGPIPLSLESEKDASIYHKVHDKIVQMWFSQKGIASKRLLYCKQNEKKNFQVVCSDYNAHNPKIITKPFENCITPKFIPNKSGQSAQFLVVNYRSGQPKVHIGSLITYETKPFIQLAGQQLLVAISLQSNALAFISDRTSQIDLFVQYIDFENKKASKPKQLFSYPNSTQSSPSFSPDGRQIVFVSDKSGHPHLYILPTNLQKEIAPLKITNLSEENTCPAWSFDGKRIAYVAKTNEVRQIWIFEVDTQKEWQLTFDNKQKENPCFAPNNLHLVYNTQEDGDCNLFLIDLRHQKPLRLTKGLGQIRYACFEP